MARVGIDRITRLTYRRQQLVNQTMLLQNQIGSLQVRAMQAKAIYQQMPTSYNRTECNKAVREYNRAYQTIMKNKQKIANIDTQIVMVNNAKARQEVKAEISAERKLQQTVNTMNRRGYQNALRVNNPYNW